MRRMMNLVRGGYQWWLDEIDATPDEEWERLHAALMLAFRDALIVFVIGIPVLYWYVYVR